MRKPLVAGNWKMNGSFEANEILLNAILSGMDTTRLACDIAIFPPAVYLTQVSELLKDSDIDWGLQNVFYENNGAYTGENSVTMAADSGCRYTLVGHSERRTIFGETDKQIAKKVEALQVNDIIPILCIGESFQEREQGKTFTVIENQIRTVFNEMDKSHTSDIIVAYEPVWAIGTGRTASPEQAQEVHSFIRVLLKDYSEVLSNQTRILYGGSVNGDNAKAIFSQADIDGGLVGGASLKPTEFLKICNAVG